MLKGDWPQQQDDLDPYGIWIVAVSLRGRPRLLPDDVVELVLIGLACCWRGPRDGPGRWSLQQHNEPCATSP